MKRALASVLVAGLGLAALSTVSFAGPNANAKILIHLGPKVAKNACSVNPTCANVVTAGGLYPTIYYAYLMVTDCNNATGLAGLQCGLNYNAAPQAGVDIFGWTLCATLEFASAGPNGPWPASGSGNLITWDASTRCQLTEPGGPGTGVSAPAGYFYLGAYTPDLLSVTPRPVDGTAKVADCNSVEDLIGGTGYPAVPSHLGTANFSAGGATGGYNPCGLITPVQATTWSNIKSGFSGK